MATIGGATASNNLLWPSLALLQDATEDDGSSRGQGSWHQAKAGSPVDGVDGHVVRDACQQACNADLDGALRAVAQHAAHHNVSNVLHQVSTLNSVASQHLPRGHLTKELVSLWDMRGVQLSKPCQSRYEEISLADAEDRQRCSLPG